VTPSWSFILQLPDFVFDCLWIFSQCDVSLVRGNVPSFYCPNFKLSYMFRLKRSSLRIVTFCCLYRGADKSLARPGRKQANVSVRMAWISFGALPCRKKKTWQLASRCCWNRARPWHASELVSFLIGLRTYQQPGKTVRAGRWLGLCRNMWRGLCLMAAWVVVLCR